MAASIPDSKFSTEIFEPKERRNPWIEGAKPMHDVSPTDRGNTDFNGSVEAWNVDDICFANVEYDAQIMRRRKGKHKISGDQNYLFAAIYREGFARALHDGKAATSNLNGVIIVDYSRDRRSVSSAAKMHGVIASYQAGGYELGKHSSSIDFPNETPSDCLLSRLSGRCCRKGQGVRKVAVRETNFDYDSMMWRRQ